MTKPRGNRSSDALIEQRRKRLLELKKNGVSVVDAEKILTAEGFPADRVTLQRDLKKLRETLAESNDVEFAALVRELIDVRIRALEELWAGELPPDVANSINSLVEGISRLTGSNAPARSMALRMNLTLAAKDAPWSSLTPDQFCHRLGHDLTYKLSPDQTQQVIALAERLYAENPWDPQAEVIARGEQLIASLVQAGAVEGASEQEKPRIYSGPPVIEVDTDDDK